ncbi:DUF3426 domain-containing protein [Stenotrophomonas sp. Y6]|uniref:DUF3426 domain-containing protein n=1 Tax=Stenotrophomonas sp. Y6 TaxID=2920383 RepID=UPI001F0576D7|nr:DUF3426 domain-containing protein [Stenotrophomonas sp. Y6]MCH1908723.1 DUF3426 domain-containing protein [Stenotrophomonas sp. Y6]
MSEETPPPRPSLATLLRSGATPPPDTPPARDGDGDVDGGGDAPQPVPPADGATDGEAPALGDAAADSAQDGDGPAQESGSAPSFLQRSPVATASGRRAPRWQWLLLAALALLLAVQVVIADRATLAARPGWRPVVAGLCAVLRCSLPPWHQPAAYTMLQREVRPLPGRPGVLQVQASFRNDARWAQAWPALSLSLSDADGRVIGRRLLQPRDYLGSAHDPAQRLEPGQSAQVAFLLREPSAATVAYAFEFR